MQISLRTDAAIKILLYIGAHDPNRWVPVPEIAYALDTSFNTLQPIVYEMALNHIVLTHRGRGGGVKLTRPLSEILLSEVVSVGEQEAGWQFAACDRLPACNCFLTGQCTMQLMYRDLHAHILSFLSARSVEELQSTGSAAAAQQRYAEWVEQGHGRPPKTSNEDLDLLRS